MYLSFIDDDKLIGIVDFFLDKMINATKTYDVLNNDVDPFSFLFNVTFHQRTVEEWMAIEKDRQSEKGLQNHIGTFHQKILGNSHGWVDLGTGGIVDIRSESKKIVAEIKNKHNTVKGSDLPSVYDSLDHVLSLPENDDFTGYYVEVIPRKKKDYNSAFTPSDNKLSARRPINEKIRKIDGKSFYSLVAGYDNALKDLYLILPDVIGKRLGIKFSDMDKTTYLSIFMSSYYFR